MTDKQSYRDAEAMPIVLRDVVMQGQVALARPSDRHAGASRPQGPSLVPVQAAHRTEPRLAGTPSAFADSMVAEPAVQAAAVQIEEEARRRGHEEGLAKGLAEGRERAAEDARQAAAEAEHKAARDLEARAERLTQELQKQAQAAVEARVQALNGLIDGLPLLIEARLADAEDDMLALCFETVCRMLGEAAAQPGLVRAQLAQAMSRLRSRRLVAIHLHPDDLAALQRTQEASTLPGGEDVQWIASAEVALGGCILQSPEGGLDARFETQLHALRDLLLQSRALARHQEA